MKETLLRLKVNTQVTIVILIANVVIWIALELAGGSTNSYVLLRYGALYEPLVMAGEVWRFISSAFLHIGIFHLLINSYTLYNLGTFIENYFGQTKLIATYVITAICAGIFSLIFNNGISAGASGALFGLVGLILGNHWAKKVYTFDLPIDERQLIPFVFINLYYGFVMPNIDNAAHIGGLLGGIALGYLFDPSLSFDPSPIKKFLPGFLGKLSITLLAISTVFWLLSIFGISIISYL